MFYRKTIKELKEQIRLLKLKNHNLIKDNEMLKEQNNLYHEISWLNRNMDELKKRFERLEENIIGRIIK